MFLVTAPQRRIPCKKIHSPFLVWSLPPQMIRSLATPPAPSVPDASIPDCSRQLLIPPSAPHHLATQHHFVFLSLYTQPGKRGQ
ncbi:hypothetical protein RSAG8_04567, partial [Rhizoctonia solani AG-8 WAC10335]